MKDDFKYLWENASSADKPVIERLAADFEKLEGRLAWTERALDIANKLLVRLEKELEISNR